MVKQVRGRVVVGGLLSLHLIDMCGKIRSHIIWNLVGMVDGEVILFHGVVDVHRLRAVGQHAGVTYLTSRLRVERGLVEDNLEVGLIFGSYLSVFQNLAGA